MIILRKQQDVVILGRFVMITVRPAQESLNIDIGGHKKRIKPKTYMDAGFYFCPVCRRAYSLKSRGNDAEYYPKWIMGDQDRVCPACRRRNILSSGVWNELHG